MNNILLMVLLFSFYTTSLFSQGVFTSLATGDWNVAGSWTYTGTDGDGIPDADDNVVISSTHTITIPNGTTQACNNIQIQGTSGTRVTIGTSAGATLEVYGTLDNNNQAPGANAIDCRNSVDSRFVFKRTSDGALFSGSGSWASMTAVRYEINLSTGITGTTPGAVKAMSWFLTGGTFSVTGYFSVDSVGNANTGNIFIGNGAELRVTTHIARTSTANTPFGSLKMLGNSKIIIYGTTNNPLPTVASSYPAYSFSSGAVIEYQGGTQTIGDIAYPNLIINASTSGSSKNWTLGGNRTVTGYINVVKGIFQVGGAQLTVSGNVTVDEGAQIGCSNNSGTIVAAVSGTQAFTLNGLCRVCSNASQAPTPTTGFTRQFAFDSYSFGSNSIISFRNPTSAITPTPIVVNIDQPSGASFANVEFFDLQTAGNTCEFILRQNIEVTGSISFPRVSSGQPVTFNMNGKTLKVGNQILNSLGTLGTNIGNTNSAGGTRTFTMDGTLELNGSSSQNTLGGTDLPSAFYNLKLNNSAGVTVANAVTVSNMLTLGGNNTYTNLNNISGYTGLEYAATTSQTTGSEFGASITNLTINNASGVILGDSKIVNGTLSLTSGDLDLNGKTLTLGGSALVIETSGNTIKGTTGTITTTRSLNAPSLSNIAGLGATLTSSADLGSTVITRGHTIQTGNTNNGVGRYYDITPSTNTGLNASLVFSYDESELNGIPEADLRLFRSTDGGTTWTLAGGTVDEGSNNVTLSGIDAFSRWTLGDVNDPLPVELNAFTYKLSGNKIDLSWSTATEVNNYGFEIERSLKSEVGSLMSEWNKIGFVAGSGNSNSVKEYSFTDNNLPTGKYAYRLKIVDNDGSFAYSKEIEVENLQPSTYQLSQNFPNPFNPTTTISYQIPAESNVKLLLFSVTGELVRELVNSNQSAGSYNVTLDASGLASGTYIYSLVAGDYVSVKKMVVLK